LAVTTEVLVAIQAVSRDALDWSRRVIARPAARSDLERGLSVLPARLAERDARGVERALRDARGALKRYPPALSGESGLLPDLEAISLMLDAIEAASAEAR
jgi:hypothetical protein